MKFSKITGIVCICLQLLAFIGGINSTTPMRLYFDSWPAFISSLITLITYCFLGIIGVILVVCSSPKSNSKTQEEVKNENALINEKKTIDEPTFNIICPKCNLSLPEDSIFCPNCGCNIEETEKQLIVEKSSEPEIKVVEKVVEKVVVKKSKANIILIVLLVLSLIACSFIGYFTLSFYNQIEEKEKAIEEYEDKINDLNQKYDDTRIARDTLSKLKTYDKWGYATENFHADTGIVFAKSYGNKETIKIIMNYENAICEIDTSNTAVANVYWSDKTWYYGEPAEVYIEPKSKGVSVLTFTNDSYKSTFRVLIVVT